MPFLRVEKKPFGTYLRILESYRDSDGKSTNRILNSLGKVEEYTPEQLRRLGIGLYELGGGEVKALLEGQIEELARYNYGYVQVFGKAMQHYSLDVVANRIKRSSKVQFDLYNAIMLMLIERLHDPCSKRSNWLNQHEYLGIEPADLHQLYRALDKLADNNKLIQWQIFQTGRNDDEKITIQYTTLTYEGKTIIATYSNKRAKKDKADREQKLQTAQALLKQPALLKKKASRYYLTVTGNEQYKLNEQKIKTDEAYDGILAIATNTTTLAHTGILEQYTQLYKIEHTFRTFKSHLEMRPMFHWTDKRIEGHICLCYIAYTLLHYVQQKLIAASKTITEKG